MIIEKPWGQEEIIEINDKYMLKKLIMYKGKRCSLQYHNKKTETIYVLSGKLRIYCGTSENRLYYRIYKKGDNITIHSHMIHRMEAISNSIYLETSTPEIDDVVRLEDDYKRT